MIRRIQEYTRQVTQGLMIDSGTDRRAHLALGITGEAGEVADLVKKSQYSRNEGRLDEARVREELGDLLWYLTAMAAEVGVDLEDLMHENLVKLEGRHPGRYNVETWLLV